MKELKAFGLSENEISVYIALLKLGLTTANSVAKHTGMKRSTTYDNLQLLISQGVASRSIKQNVQYYEAADPSLLVHLLEERRDALKKAVPMMKKLQHTITEKSSVSMFEGLKGAFQVLDDVLYQKELLFYGSRTMAFEVLSHYPESFRMKRVEKGIKLRAVLANEDQDYFYKEGKARKLTKIRYMKKLDRISANVFIYGDTVSFMSSSEYRVGFIIRNKDVADQQRVVFEMLWKLASVV